MAKTPNISKTQISETPQVSFQTPKAYPGGCNHHAPKLKSSFLISSLKKMCNRQCMKHQSKSLKSPFRTARVDPKKSFVSQTLSVQTTSHCEAPHGDLEHGTSRHLRRRVHHGKASTGMGKVFLDVDRTCGWKADLLGCRKSAGTPHPKISRMSMPSGLNGKDTKHLKNANLGNSTSFVPDPKSVSGGLQSPCSKIEIQLSDIESKENV